MPWTGIDNTARDRAILAMQGKLSYGLIAKELRASRSAVAGVIFRKNRERQKTSSWLRPDYCKRAEVQMKPGRKPDGSAAK